MVLAMLRPQYRRAVPRRLPPHGDLYSKLALSMAAVPAEQVMLAETGAIMEFSQDYGEITGKAPGRL